MGDDDADDDQDMVVVAVAVVAVVVVAVDVAVISRLSPQQQLSLNQLGSPLFLTVTPPGFIQHDKR